MYTIYSSVMTASSTQCHSDNVIQTGHRAIIARSPAVAVSPSAPHGAAPAIDGSSTASPSDAGHGANGITATATSDTSRSRAAAAARQAASQAAG